MKKQIVALVGCLLIILPLFAQYVEPIHIEPIRPPIHIEPIRPPVQIEPIHQYHSSPLVQPTPLIQPSEPAVTEDAKLRVAAMNRIYKYQSVLLNNTTSVTHWKDDNNYSARARFVVDGQNVAIRCVSNVRGVVAAFLEYIRGIFSGDGSSTGLTLAQIVKGARQDLRNRGFSDSDISLTYIDQFDDTHVVLILRQQLDAMIACR